MPPSTTLSESIIRQDQARELRAMVALRNGSPSAVRQPSRRCRTVAIVGSKGGVGKSVVALNLAFALAQTGATIGMLDASPGTGSLGLLCRQNGYWNLDHVAAGTRTLDEISLSAGPNVTILPGADRLRAGPMSTTIWRALIDFEGRHDWLLIDTGADLNQAADFASVADATVVVTTPEPTAVAEAYAAIKRFVARGITTSVLVNQVDTEEQGRTVMDRLRHATRAFLTSDIGLAGVVPYDVAVGQAVFRRTPLAPDEASAAHRALQEVGRRLVQTITADRASTAMESLKTLLDVDGFGGDSRATQLEGKSNCVGTFSEVGPVGLSRRNKVN